MGQYDRKDRFYRKAKEEGLASRASYKLLEIQKKFKVIKRGDIVLDLGAAPGGWLQVAGEIVGEKGMVFGIDLLPLKIAIPKNVTFHQGDIRDEGSYKEFCEKNVRADLVVSDMAPNTSGVRFKDAYLSYELAKAALDITKRFLRPGGNFVAKIFPGEEFAKFKDELGLYFEKVMQYRPEATRKTSIEVYLIGLGLK